MFGNRTPISLKHRPWRRPGTSTARRSTASSRVRFQARETQLSFILIHYTHMQLFSWNGVIKSNSQIYCYHGRVALSKAYNCYQLRGLSGTRNNLVPGPCVHPMYALFLCNALIQRDCLQGSANLITQPSDIRGNESCRLHRVVCRAIAINVGRVSS